MTVEDLEALSRHAQQFMSHRAEVLGWVGQPVAYISLEWMDISPAQLEFYRYNLNLHGFQLTDWHGQAETRQLDGFSYPVIVLSLTVEKTHDGKIV